MRKMLPYIISIGLSLGITYSLIDIAEVSGDSMLPLVHSGQTIIGIKRDFYEKGHIVVADVPSPTEGEGLIKVVKRVYGVPGDKIVVEDKTVYVNGEVLKKLESAVPNADFTLSNGEYFLLGDSPKTAWIRAGHGMIKSKMEIIR